jgi:hypothetical protein
MIAESPLTESLSCEIMGTEMFVEPMTTEDLMLFVTENSPVQACQYAYPGLQG